MLFSVYILLPGFTFKPCLAVYDSFIEESAVFCIYITKLPGFTFKSCLAVYDSFIEESAVFWKTKQEFRLPSYRVKSKYTKQHLLMYHERFLYSVYCCPVLLLSHASLCTIHSLKKVLFSGKQNKNLDYRPTGLKVNIQSSIFSCTTNGFCILYPVAVLYL